MKGTDSFMKRRFFAFLCIFSILISQFITSAKAQATADTTSQNTWPDGPSVNADGAIVMEASTGLVLYEKNIHQTYYPASITKIMTVMLAIENSNLGDIVTFSHNAVYDVDANSSRLWINEGEKLTMQQCLYGILLESANDVAYAVAEHVGGTMPDFVKMMNDKAKSIGCLNTNFVNPHGLPDDNHYTSPYDMALITREAMKNETFRKIFGTRTYEIPPTNMQSETRYLRNHHKFVLNQDYHYDGVIGGKTGYTTKAKFTLVTVAKRGDLELICVVMHDDSNVHQYTDTQKLLDYGFENFSIYPIADLEKQQVPEESPMFTRYNSLLSQTETPVETDKNGYLVLPNTASFKDAKKDITFYSAGDTKTDTNNTSLPSNSGDAVIGKISYTYDGKYVGGADILYNNSVKPVLVQQQDATKNNPTSSPNPVSVSPETDKSLHPIIIGGLVGLFVLAIGLYFVLVERPRLQRKKSYYKKKARRKRNEKDDDFFDFL